MPLSLEAAPSPSSTYSSAHFAERVRELERQVEELTGQVQQLSPPEYNAGT